MSDKVQVVLWFRYFIIYRWSSGGGPAESVRGQRRTFLYWMRSFPAQERFRHILGLCESQQNCSLTWCLVAERISCSFLGRQRLELSENKTTKALRGYSYRYIRAVLKYFFLSYIDFCHWDFLTPRNISVRYFKKDSPTSPFHFINSTNCTQRNNLLNWLSSAGNWPVSYEMLLRTPEQTSMLLWASLLVLGK